MRDTAEHMAEWARLGEQSVKDHAQDLELIAAEARYLELRAKVTARDFEQFKADHAQDLESL